MTHVEHIEDLQKKVLSLGWFPLSFAGFCGAPPRWYPVVVVSCYGNVSQVNTPL